MSRASASRRRRLVVVGRVRPGEFMEGGRVRIQYVGRAFERLGLETTYLDPEAVVGPRGFARALAGSLGRALAAPRGRLYLVANGTPPAVPVLRLLRRRATPLFFDLHDDPRLQYRDLGIRGDTAALAAVGRRIDEALRTFALVGFPTLEFSELFELPAARKVEVRNATDPSHFDPNVPAPRGVVSLVGSTSPGRGADLLIEACTLARVRVPELRLRLALTDPGGGGNLDELRARHREPWLSYESVDYRGLPAFLAGSTVCIVPHRRSRYLDLALPIKLFDYMAAGRPVVVTRCAAMGALVERERCGLVADFGAEDLAERIATLLEDPGLAAKLARNGREAVEREYNWERTADAVHRAVEEYLEREP